MNELQKRLAAEGYNKDMIKDKVREEVLEPLNEIKLSIFKKKMPETDRRKSLPIKSFQGVLRAPRTMRI